MNREEFIERSNEAHNHKYGYDGVVFINTRTKVEIICPVHGMFEQIPSNHLRGRGCKGCAYDAKRSTHDAFISKARVVHDSFYDYSKVGDIVNHHTPVCIICPQHGEFHQTPDNHLHGKGCNQCGVDGSILTTDEFVGKARLEHGDDYSYDASEYEHSKTPITIICDKHGEFQQLPNTHLQGKGCPKCVNRQSKGELEVLEYVKEILFIR